MDALEYFSPPYLLRIMLGQNLKHKLSLSCKITGFDRDNYARLRSQVSTSTARLSSCDWFNFKIHLRLINLKQVLLCARFKLHKFGHFFCNHMYPNSFDEYLRLNLNAKTCFLGE